MHLASGADMGALGAKRDLEKFQCKYAAPLCLVLSIRMS